MTIGPFTVWAVRLRGGAAIMQIEMSFSSNDWARNVGREIERRCVRAGGRAPIVLEKVIVVGSPKQREGAKQLVGFA